MYWLCLLFRRSRYSRDHCLSWTLHCVSGLLPLAVTGAGPRLRPTLRNKYREDLKHPSSGDKRRFTKSGIIIPTVLLLSSLFGLWDWVHRTITTMSSAAFTHIASLHTRRAICDEKMPLVKRRLSALDGCFEPSLYSLPCIVGRRPQPQTGPSQAPVLPRHWGTL